MRRNCEKCVGLSMKFIKTLPLNLIFGGILVLRQEPMYEYMEHIILKLLFLCASHWFVVVIFGCRGMGEMHLRISPGLSSRERLQQCLDIFLSRTFICYKHYWRSFTRSLRELKSLKFKIVLGGPVTGVVGGPGGPGGKTFEEEGETSSQAATFLL